MPYTHGRYQIYHDFVQKISEILRALPWSRDGEGCGVQGRYLPDIKPYFCPLILWPVRLLSMFTLAKEHPGITRTDTGAPQRRRARKTATGPQQIFSEYEKTAANSNGTAENQYPARNSSIAFEVATWFVMARVRDYQANGLQISLCTREFVAASVRNQACEKYMS